VEKPVTVGGGSHDWWILAWNTAGDAWSAKANFVTPVLTAPEQVDLGDEDYTDPVDGQNLGTIYNPPFIWKKADRATWYLLYVSGPGGVGVIVNQWYPASVCDTTKCVVESPVTLTGGNDYKWWVLSWNAAGSKWSAGNVFDADIQTTPKATTLFLNSLPNANLKTKPVYTWSNVPQATWYRMYVKGPYGLVLDQWYRSRDVCFGAYCSVESPTTLASGDHTWWVQTYNSAGYGPWRSAIFRVQSVSSVATNLSPQGGEEINDTMPIYSWDKVSTATRYHLYVLGPKTNSEGTVIDGVVLLDKWYESLYICSNTTNICSVDSPVELEAGDHTWSVMTYNSTAGYGLWKTETFDLVP